MSSALFLFSMIAVLLLFWWLVQNDRDESDSGYKGLFALRRKQVDPGGDAPVETPQSRWRRPRS